MPPASISGFSQLAAEFVDQMSCADIIALSGLAVQVHHFSKLLLLEHMPAFEGLKELARRAPIVQECVDMISGIASCTTEEAALIVSTQCLYAAGIHVQEVSKQHQVRHYIDWTASIVRYLLTSAH